MKIDYTFLTFVVLALAALAGSAFAEEITTCGNYANNNTVYYLMNNITTDGSTYGGYCLNLTGYNQTLQGEGYTISSSNITAGAAVRIAYTGDQVYNLRINGFLYGVWLGATSNNATLYYLWINGSGQGIRTVSNTTGVWNFFGLIYVRNATTGLYISNGGNNLFTNCDFNGSTDDINNIGTGTQYDNGFNYWDDCSGAGGCAWYDVAGATIANANPTGDAPVNSSATSTNYGSVSTYGFKQPADDNAYFTWTPAINKSTGILAPIFTSFIFTEWANQDSGTAVLSCDLLNQSFTEGTITYENRPTNTSTMVGSTFQPLLAYTQGTWTANAAALSAMPQYYFMSSRTFGVHTFNTTAKSSAKTITHVFKENATGRPRGSYVWRPASPNINGTYASDHYLLALDSATYCLIIYPTSSNPTITNYWTGENVSQLYTGAANATRNWTAFTCSEGNIYTVNFADPNPIITTAPCEPTVSVMIANFTFVNETSRAGVLVNVSITAVGSTEDGSFNQTTTLNNTGVAYVCRPNWASTLDGEFTVYYSNTTAAPRYYYLTADETTATNISVYVLASTSASYIKFNVMNQFGNPLADRELQLLRYLPETATYLFVAMATTDDNGETTVPLYSAGGSYYTIYVYDGTDLEKTFANELVVCYAGSSCEHDLVISDVYDESEFWEDYGSVSWNCSEGTTGSPDPYSLVSCSWTDGTGNPHNFTLQMWKINATGMTLQDCDPVNSSASGTVSCLSDDPLNGSIFTWKFTRHSDERVLADGMVDGREAAYKAIGAVYAFMVIIVCAFAGIAIPGVGVIVAVIGLAVASWLGLIEIGVAAIVGLMLAAVILAWKQGGG